jgi:hypothetical protein
MASKLGSIYVELSLDDKVYKQKLAAMPADAQATTKGLETSWRSLGVKTNQYFEDSRKAAENAYKLIEKSGKYSADEIARAEKAKNDKINQYNEQQFGKTEGLLTKLKNNWVVAAASITAAYMAAQKAWNLADQAAKYEQSAVAFHTMATSMGKDATTEFNKIREASKGLIDEKSLTEATNKALSLGIPLESIAALMEIAQAKSRDMGTTTQQAFSDIATGVGRASPLILDNLGLVMKVGSANEQLAAKLGKSTEELTDQEKKTAILNATLEAGKEAVARYNLEQLTTAERMQSLSATVTNVQLLIGQGLIRAFAGAQGAMQTLASGALVAVAGFYKLQQASMTVASWTSFGDAAKRYAAAAKEAGDNSAAAMGASEELAGKAAASFAAMTASTTDLANATTTGAKATTRYSEALGNSGKAATEAAKAAKKAAEERMKWEENAYKKEMELFAKTEEENAKYLAQMAKDAEDAAKAEIKSWQKAADVAIDLMKDEGDAGAKLTKETLERMDKEEKAALDLADKRSTAMRAMYKDLDGYEGQYYTSMKEMIEKQRQDYEKLTGDKVASERWATNQLKLLDIEKGKSSDSFVAGVKAGFEEMKTKAYTFGQAGYEIFNTFQKSSSDAISDGLFSMIKTGTADLKTIWDTWSSSILKKFTDATGEMVTQWIIDKAKIALAAGSPITMVFQALWDAGSALVIAAIEGFKKIWNNWYEGGLIPGYAYGRVPGQASVTGDSPRNDTHLAWVSPGEFIMPRSAVNGETLPLLEHLRKNKGIRGYAEGGPVDYLPGLAWRAGFGFYDEDEPWEDLKQKYKDLFHEADLTYYNGKWGQIPWNAIIEDGGSYRATRFDEVSNPIQHTGGAINDKYNYNLMAAQPGAGLNNADWEYLMNWYGSALHLFQTTSPEDTNVDFLHYSAALGSVDPNVIWREPMDNDQIRTFFRDGTNYVGSTDPSNFLDKFMPGIIGAISAVMAAYIGWVAAAYIAAAGSIGVGGVTGGAIMDSGVAAGTIGGLSAANLGAAAGGGLFNAFMTYGETGNLTATAIGGLMGALAGYVTGASGLFNAVGGEAAAQVVRFGAKKVLGMILGDVFGAQSGGGANLSWDASGGSGLSGILEGIQDIAPKTMSVPLSSGLDYVPYDNFPARLHKGERVLTKEENRDLSGGAQTGELAPVLVNLVLDGKVLASTLYKQSRAGIKIIHERGLAYA